MRKFLSLTPQDVFAFIFAALLLAFAYGWLACVANAGERETFAAYSSEWCLKQKVPVVVFVGCEPRKVAGCAVAVADEMDGIADGSIVVYPMKGKNWRWDSDASDKWILAKAFPAPALHEAVEALDEVNAERATHGLKPFTYDEGLTAGAMAVARYRAERHIAGHTTGDFAFLPPGTSADAAGCAAWPAGLGFGSCCMYEQWDRCGAAFAFGADGRRYMHVFVAGGSGNKAGERLAPPRRGLR